MILVLLSSVFSSRNCYEKDFVLNRNDERRAGGCDERNVTIRKEELYLDEPQIIYPRHYCNHNQRYPCRDLYNFCERERCNERLKNDNVIERENDRTSRCSHYLPKYPRYGVFELNNYPRENVFDNRYYPRVINRNYPKSDDLEHHNYMQKIHLYPEQTDLNMFNPNRKFKHEKDREFKNEELFSDPEDHIFDQDDNEKYIRQDKNSGTHCSPCDAKSFVYRRHY
ncbi:hypothetical protein GVAV_002615 [Gurleya vavrai]